MSASGSCLLDRGEFLGELLATLPRTPVSLPSENVLDIFGMFNPPLGEVFLRGSFSFLLSWYVSLSLSLSSLSPPESFS